MGCASLSIYIWSRVFYGEEDQHDLVEVAKTSLDSPALHEGAMVDKVNKKSNCDMLTQKKHPGNTRVFYDKDFRDTLMLETIPSHFDVDDDEVSNLTCDSSIEDDPNEDESPLLIEWNGTAIYENNMSLVDSRRGTLIRCRSI